MAELIIGDKIYEAKTGFKFKNIADKKYKTEQKDAKGNTTELDGFMSVYLALLEYDLDALKQFWDCALAHKGNDRPTIEQIENALDEKIESDGDVDQSFQEAFQVLDQSGFFKKAVKQIKDGLLQDGPEPKENETEEEKEKRKQEEEAAKIMKERYEELSGQSLTK